VVAAYVRWISAQFPLLRYTANLVVLGADHCGQWSHSRADIPGNQLDHARQIKELLCTHKYTCWLHDRRDDWLARPLETVHLVFTTNLSHGAQNTNTYFVCRKDNSKGSPIDSGENNSVFEAGRKEHTVHDTKLHASLQKYVWFTRKNILSLRFFSTCEMLIKLHFVIRT